MEEEVLINNENQDIIQEDIIKNINIEFLTKGNTAIKRSERGIVALILADSTEGGNPIEIFNSVTDIDFTTFTERNYEYLKLVYEGSPSKVIVARIPEEEEPEPEIPKEEEPEPEIPEEEEEPEPEIPEEEEPEPEIPEEVIKSTDNYTALFLDNNDSTITVAYTGLETKPPIKVIWRHSQSV